MPKNEDDDLDIEKFMILLSGIMPETPLGQIVQIRSETDPDAIKHMSPGQKKIRNDWLSRRRKERYQSMSEKEKIKQIEMIQKAFSEAYS